jgi:hypothetical protein
MIGTDLQARADLRFGGFKSRGGRERSPKMVQGLLGHGSIVMTLDVYGHLFPKGDDKAELAEASALQTADRESVRHRHHTGIFSNENNVR